MGMRNSMSRRRFLRVGLGVGASAGLAACATAPAPAVIEKVVEREVTVMVEGTPQIVKETVVVEVTAAPKQVTEQIVIRVGSIASENLLIAYRRILLPRFADAHPEINVKFETGPWGEYMPKQQAQIAAGDLPDVFRNPNYDLPAIYTRDVLLDLNPMIEGDTEVAEVIPELAWGLFMDAEERRWAAPQSIGGNALAYNETLFDEAGLEYPTDTWTYEDFLEASILLTKDENGRNPTDAGFDAGAVKQYGYYARNYATTDYGPQSYGFGGSWYKDPGFNLEANFDDPKTIEAFQWTMDLVGKHRVAPSIAEAEGFGTVYQIGFLGGFCAMMIAHQGQEGSWPVGEWKQEKWKNGEAFQVTRLPKWPVRRSNLIAGQGFCIPAYSKAKEAAWAFTRFAMLDVPWQAGQTDPGKYGLPANRKAWEEANVLNRDTPPFRNQRAFVEALEDDWDGYMWNFDPSPIWLENWMSITNQMALVWEGELGVPEAMAAIQKECLQHAADYRASL